MQIAGANDLLELRIEQKTYRSADGVAVDVLRDFHLQIAKGDAVALIGPSGCGKSTILRIAAGLDTGFAGERRMQSAVRISMVFQEPTLLVWRTVEENIRIAMDAASVAGPIEELLARLDLSNERNRYAGELSLGQARRAAIGRALSIRPDFLLLDEPFASLDVAVATRLREELLNLTLRDRTSMLLVTHNLEEAVQLTDRLVFLGGRPARIVAERQLAVPRGQRDQNAVAAMVSGLGEIVKCAG
jgi:NitT/TauT family transport system ATP-binding protein